MNRPHRTEEAKPPLHAGQAAIARSTARFRVVACGRRFGKTELGKRLLIEAASQPNAIGWWIAPTYRMAGGVWRDLERTLRSQDAHIDRHDWRIDLPAGGSITIRSASQPDRLRGAGIDFVVLDEAAFLPAPLWPEVVRPMLMDRAGRALFLSTPAGRNWFFACYLLGQDPLQPDWESFTFTSYDNPLLPPGEIESLRDTTPEAVFRAEYLAEFTDDDADVFRNVRAAVRPVPALGGVARVDAAHRYVVGIDWGCSRDYTAAVVIDASAVPPAVVALDRFNRIGWEQQRGRIKTLCETFGATTVWAEENSIGAPNIEALQRDGLPVRPFKMTAASKPGLIDALVLAIERGDLALLDDPVLLGELTAYRMERLPGGGFRYSAPPGQHDDCVIALALAWHAAARAANVAFF